MLSKIRKNTLITVMYVVCYSAAWKSASYLHGEGSLRPGWHTPSQLLVTAVQTRHYTDVHTEQCSGKSHYSTIRRKKKFIRFHIYTSIDISINKSITSTTYRYCGLRTNLPLSAILIKSVFSRYAKPKSQAQRAIIWLSKHFSNLFDNKFLWKWTIL